MDLNNSHSLNLTMDPITVGRLMKISVIEENHQIDLEAIKISIQNQPHQLWDSNSIKSDIKKNKT